MQPLCVEQCNSLSPVLALSLAYLALASVEQPPSPPRQHSREADPRLAFRPRSLQTSLNALHDHAPFELREDSKHLKEESASWGGGVDALLVEVEVSMFAVEVVEEGHEVLQAAAQPIDRPRGDHVELPVNDSEAQLIECGPTLSTFRTADPLVDEPFDNLPPFFDRHCL